MSETKSRPLPSLVAMNFHERQVAALRSLAPFSVDAAGYIWCESAKGGRTVFANVRGWGYLTGKGHGALGLSDEEGIAEQKRWGDAIVYALNDFVRDPSNRKLILAEVDARCWPEDAKGYRFSWERDEQSTRTTPTDVPLDTRDGEQ